MTREEALNVIRNEIDLCEEESVDALALEDAYSFVEHSITLDRIKEARAEIIKESFQEDEEYSVTKLVYLGDVLAVIDKLITESEGKE